MRARGEIVGAVDFGSRDVRVIIARKEEDGDIQILGHGAAPGRGCVSQGVVQDLHAAQSALKAALGDAEREARVHVPSLFCGINGRNVETFIRESRVELEREVVEQRHLDEALEHASRDVLDAGKRIVSSISAQEWYVDELRVLDPIGIRGHVLKTRVHFARIPSVIEDNLAHCIESQKRELEDLIFLPIASALGCLTPEDMELGVAVMDMGRGTTGLAVYRDRRILASQCFEWGGYHLTRDVAAGLQVSFEEADDLILEYGVADSYLEADDAAELKVVNAPPVAKSGAPLKLKTVVHGAPSIVSRDELDEIIFERAHELFTKARQHLSSRGLLKHLVRGVVLTGGTAQIRNMDKLAETVFQTPCRIGIPEVIAVAPQAVRQATYSGVVGVAMHGFAYRAAGQDGRGSHGRIAAGAQSLTRWFRKYFF